MRNRAVSLVLVALLAVLPGRAAAQDRSDYNALASIVSEPVFDSSSVARGREAYTDGGVMSRKEYERQRLNSLYKLDDKLQAARERIAEPLWQCYSTYQEIRRLDSRTPDYEGLAMRTLQASPALVKKYNKENLSADDKKAVGDLAAKAIWEIGGAIVNSYQLSSERDKYRQHYRSSRVTNRGVMTDLVARRYSTSRPTASAPGGGEVIGIWVNPSFANTYIADVITLRNNSGKDLTGCTLLVQLSGLNARTNASEGDSHFHFIRSWPAGETRYLWYPSRSLPGIARDESVDVMQKIEVRLYTDQITSTASLNLAGGLYDRLLKEWAERHLAPARFSGRWYTNAENFVDPAGFEAQYNGDLSWFAFRMVVIEASDVLRSVRIRTRASDTGWSLREKKWIYHKDFNPVNPGTIKVIISFPGSSYEHVVVWNR
jgi:hypothetical protein